MKFSVENQSEKALHHEQFTIQGFSLLHAANSWQFFQGLDKNKIDFFLYKGMHVCVLFFFDEGKVVNVKSEIFAVVRIIALSMVYFCTTKSQSVAMHFKVKCLMWFFPIYFDIVGLVEVLLVDSNT